MATGVDVLGDVETEEATRVQWMSVSGVTQRRRQLRNRRIERSGEVSVYMMNGNFVMSCGCDSKPSAIISRLSEQFLFVRPEVIELSPISEDGRSRTAMLKMTALVRVNALIWQPPETCSSCLLPSRHDDIMLEFGDFGCDGWEPYPQNPFGPLLRYLSNDVLAWSPPALMCKWCWQSGAPLLCFEPDPEFLNDDFFNAYVQLLWPGENATCGENAGKLWMSRTTDAWNHRFGGWAWRSRGFIRPRRDLGDWLALVHFDDGGDYESYLLETYAARRCDFQNEALAQSLVRLKSTIAEVAPGALSSSQRSVATVPVAVNSSTCGHALTGFTSLRASTQSQMNPSGFALQSDLF